MNEDFKKIVGDYLKSDAKIRDRLYETHAVQQGYATIYSALFWQDVKHHIRALKYIFLKDPTKPLEDLKDEDLITEKEFDQYFSQNRKEAGNQTVGINQSAELVQTRLTYRDLLASDDVKRGPAKDLRNAFERFGIPPFASVNEISMEYQRYNSELQLVKST